MITWNTRVPIAVFSRRPTKGSHLTVQPWSGAENHRALSVEEDPSLQVAPDSG